MDFQFSRELETFRKEVKDFCNQELPTDWVMGDFFAEEAFETAEQWNFYRSFKRKLGGKGWLSIGWPPKYGGQGSRMKFAIFVKELHY